jgi:hypothetical protein
LYDKDLMNVDPHDKKLSKEIQAKVLVEIVKNPFYYLREVVRIPAPGASLKFELNRGTLATLWAILNNLNIFLMLPRQRGKTIGVAALLTWIYSFGTDNSSFIFSNKTVADANNNLKRFKDIKDLLPQYIKDAINHAKDTNNVESVVGVKRNNRITCSGQPINEDLADKQGRGQSVPILWYDEFAFLKFNDTIYKSAGPAQSKIAEVAKANGKPYSKIITTTPNNIDVPEGTFCHGMMTGSAEFTEELYDWSKEEIEAYIETNSDNDFLFIKFTWQQLGLSQQWYNKECRVLANDTLKIKRELDMVWTKATDNSVFKEELLDAISALLPDEPLETFFLEVERKEKRANDPEGKIHEKYALKIYRELDLEKRYFIGVDTAGGTGRDNSAFTIVDPNDMGICATFKNPKINISYYTDLLQNLIEDILPNSILIIERNSYGKSLIDNLVRVIPDNIFYDIPLADKDKEKGKVSDKENIVYGINTTSQSRDAMIDLLVGFVNDEPELLAIPEIYEDVKTLVYDRNGKVEHERGCHDDSLFSYLFVRYAVAYSNTIHIFMQLMSRISDNAAVLNTINRQGRQLMANELNKVEKVSSEIAALSIEELIQIKDSGMNVREYLKQKHKNPALEGRREVTINRQTLSFLK